MYTMSARGRRSVVLVVALWLLALSGCARLTSIYRSDSIPTDEPHLVSVDAKQRVVLTAPVKADATSRAVLSFCAEPPPDVFTALATSLGAEASVGQGADPAIAAKLATSISENAATVERSQTVNILREAMYRNCERYLSGAYDAEEFIVQAARDQQLIVQVLAIEQLTGAARAQATALTTIAKSSASGVTDTGIETLANAKKDYESKLVLSDKARSAATGTAPPAGECPVKPYDPAAPPTGATADQVKAKNEACAAARTAETRTSESKAYLATVQDAVARQSEVSSQSQGSISSAAMQAATVSEAIGKHVADIVRQNSAFDEIGMTCVVKLRQLVGGATLSPYCEKIIDRLMQTRQAELLITAGFDQNRINAFALGFLEKAHANADVVWNYLASHGGVTKASLQALAKIAGVRIPDTRLTEFAATTSQQTFSQVFQRLDNPTQAALRNAAGQ